MVRPHEYSNAGTLTPRNRSGAYNDEPIAVVGMACRFPGSDGLEEYWDLLQSGRSAVTGGGSGSEVGRIAEIFSNTDPRNQASRFAAFIDDVEQFDTSFFRISPLEAQYLDPQQRLALEMSWKALEDAGIDPNGLRGSRTGVYGGILRSDYRGLAEEVGNASGPASSLYAATGTSSSTAIGRISYVLGLQGPAISVDTACSSSLVAVHQAVSGLRQDEADLALAGGVNVILSADVTDARANAGMLAPDGRCKTFDASANGYVRGEGCGMLVLKRLSDAEADGDRIWGVIIGSALNQDGASAGLTVPNGEAQELVIKDALHRAGVLPSQVDYVEAHGTGTSVGDPLELQALVKIFGKERKPESPLFVGSVKTNFGHLESAAGIASLIKTLLSMHHGLIPKHLNFHDPSPAIDWENVPIRVPDSATAWPDTGRRPRLASVSGYGWSGTNAHMVLEGYGAPQSVSTQPYRRRLPVGAPQHIDTSLTDTTPESPDVEVPAARPARLLPLSGKTGQALRDVAARYETWLDDNTPYIDSPDTVADPLLSDMAWTASIGRSHFPHRAGVVFRDVESLREGLSGVGVGVKDADPGRPTRVAFVYTGQGSQWVGMGRTLYETEPVVRAVLDRCERVILEERGKSLLDVMFGREGAEGDLTDTAWTQPAIFALQCALTALWESVGVRPDVVIGHSLGELAAAHAAGVFGFEDGLKFVLKRGDALASVPELGSMAAIFATQGRVEEAIQEFNATSDCADLNIAVDNGFHQVISGPTAAVQAVAERFESEEVRVRLLRTGQAFHSVLVEPALDSLEKSYEEVTASPPSVALVSNVTGRTLEEGQTLDGAYWRRHARQPVQFRRSIGSLAELGVDVAIEVGPNAVLGPLVPLIWPGTADVSEAGEEPVVLQSMIRPWDDIPTPESEAAFVSAVAGAYEAGLPISFAGLFANEDRSRIELPGYPFQRERYWVDGSRRRNVADGHPLLGTRHESPRGEVMFETEMFPSDPPWLADHQVFGRVIMPGAMYGAAAAAVSLKEGAGSVNVEDLQLHSPLIFGLEDDEDNGSRAGRRIQAVLDSPEDGKSRHIEIYSKGESEDGWTLHAEAKLAFETGTRGPENRIDLDSIKSGLQPQDVAGFYRARADADITLGTSFRTLQSLWSGSGEAVGEIAVQEVVDQISGDLHPTLLDGCFQVISAARHSADIESGETYLPFGWERMWLSDTLPECVVCHARLRETPPTASDDDGPADVREVLVGDLTLHAPDGTELGGLSGYAVKRATRAALLSETAEVQDLFYETVWREGSLSPSIVPADFLANPTRVAEQSVPLTSYVLDEGVEPDVRSTHLVNMARLSSSLALRALDRLGWTAIPGETIDPETLRKRLNVLDEHRHLFRRILEILGRAGILEESGDRFIVKVGHGDPLPEVVPADPEDFAAGMMAQFPQGSSEVQLFMRCAGALAESLTGQADPLTLLFSSGEPTAATLYRANPVARGANFLLADVMAALLGDLPEGRKLRVVEIGAGTGASTEFVLPELPEGRFEYFYTDISAGFFAEAEEQFGDAGGAIQYRTLDIENDPEEQGYEPHGYDLLVASNVLHATKSLDETLTNCRKLLRPSGLLVALENPQGLDWLDLTFGQLDGWWRFVGDYRRAHHALVSTSIWRSALEDTGFHEIEMIGPERTSLDQMAERVVIVARGPTEVLEPSGTWVITEDEGGVAEEVAAALASRNQTVVLAAPESGPASQPDGLDSRVSREVVETDRRESWNSLFQSLPSHPPLKGVVHLMGLDGHGIDGTAEELGQDTRRATGSALALVQGMSDADVTPQKGTWLITRGAQILERERFGEPAGAVLWGFGKVISREASHLNSRMIDLDPSEPLPLDDIANELMYPDDETHIAYRMGRRQLARLIRASDQGDRATLPEEPLWFLDPDPDGEMGQMQVIELPHEPLGPRDVRLSIEAAGVNFWDVMRSIGAIDEGLMGEEVCGRVLEVGADVHSVKEGDRVVALTYAAFGSETVTHEDLVAIAPEGFSTTALATIPTAFVTASVSYDLVGLKSGDRVLIHSGAGGVGLAAIQLARAAGAEVFATASSPKQAYLRSIGVRNVFDSRQTKFGQEVLEATGGEGIDVVLNSLTGEGFIEASLSCLAHGGRFVELARRNIYSEEEMASARPDVDYHILELDVLKRQRPEEPGASLDDVVARLASGELEPIVHNSWSMGEAASAIRFMRDARHIGKLVLTNSPLEKGTLRKDRSYLITGGLGGIGCALAAQLADWGAGAIVLNGRRPPDPEAEQAIAELRERGMTVSVEIADVTDTHAVDAMLARIDDSLPPLAGVIHSVGVLSDAAITNQTWESFEQVLWPKVIGAWHLHRATMSRDLDMFVLFSSTAGTMGNPGQSNHAAANTFLDQLAIHRRALGLPGQTIAWGAWSEIGEAEEQRERIMGRIAATGTGWITPQQGLRAFEALLRQEVASCMVTSVDWETFLSSQTKVSPFLDEMFSATEVAEESPEDEVDLLTQLRSTSQDSWENVLAPAIQRELQTVMRLDTEPSPSVGFFDLGMDSLMAVEFRNRLNRAFLGEYAVSNTAVFDYPDINSLSLHIAEEVGQLGIGGEPSTVPESVSPEPRPAVGAEDDGIAIVGMACRFPRANSLPEYWDLLVSGVDAVTDSRSSFDVSTADAALENGEKPAYLSGAFIDDIEWFDSRFFRISPIEARSMDPQQRMILETSWQVVEDAGIDPEALRGSNTGVFAGVGGSEYRDLLRANGAAVGTYLGTTPSVTVGRVAFALGLEGPAMPFDLACASSLVAIHQAAGSLKQGEVDLALAGGVHAALSPDVARFMADLGLLSRSGQCSPFDESADGFVRGEGCGMVVLKRLKDAEADGDRIWGVIRGSAVNQNGASAGLTVPNGSAEEHVMEAALAQAAFGGAEVDYIEAHATGSQLGDAIEMRAVGAVYGKGRESDNPLLIGTVKSNIGHLEPAAGIAGVLKTLLAMKHGVIPKQLHFNNPNPEIDWDSFPVQVTSTPTDWPRHPGRPPRAAVSAFGISGANAHVVLEGYGSPADDFGTGNGTQLFAGPSIAIPASLPESMDGTLTSTEQPVEREVRVLPLSGKSEGAVRDLARQYLSWLDEHADELSSDAATAQVLADMAWTASVGRSHFAHRAGLPFRDAASIRDALKSVAEADVDPDAPSPQPATRVAFVYAGEGDRLAGMGRELYETEPTARAVLDFCDSVARQVRGTSLLDVIFAGEGLLDDPAWTQPAVYSLECALTALWSDIGVRPTVVIGNGAGELSAAQAAGVFSLEDGMRLSLARGSDHESQQSAVAGIRLSAPSVTLMSGNSGEIAEVTTPTDDSYWASQMQQDTPSGAKATALSDLEVDLLIEVGPGSVLRPGSHTASPDQSSSSGRALEGHMAAVAKVYEAGLSISFEGMFTGETRRRIPLPSYPFQRRRHWV